MSRKQTHVGNWAAIGFLDVNGQVPQPCSPPPEPN
jgi:hypothetical protein